MSGFPASFPVRSKVRELVLPRAGAVYAQVGAARQRVGSRDVPRAQWPESGQRGSGGRGCSKEAEKTERDMKNKSAECDNSFPVCFLLWSCVCVVQEQTTEIKCIAISLTLISKIGNNFFQNNQKIRHNRNQPE